MKSNSRSRTTLIVVAIGFLIAPASCEEQAKFDVDVKATKKEQTPRVISAHEALPRSIELEGVRVEVIAAHVGKIELKGLSGGQSKNDLLAIKVRITNLSDTKKLSYFSWADDVITDASGARLTDEYDNIYAGIDFGFGDVPVGRALAPSVYPGKSVEDVLIFEPPIAKANSLKLWLGGLSIRAHEDLVFTIPTSMITR